MTCKVSYHDHCDHLCPDSTDVAQSKAAGRRIADQDNALQMVPSLTVEKCDQAEGLKLMYEKIVQNLAKDLKHPKRAQPDDPRDRHLLLCGPRGMGKRLMLQWGVQMLHSEQQKLRSTERRRRNCEELPGVDVYYLWGDERKLDKAGLEAVFKDSRKDAKVSLLVFDNISCYLEDPSTARFLISCLRISNTSTSGDLRRFVIAAADDEDEPDQRKLEEIFTYNHHEVRALGEATVAHIIRRTLQHHLKHPPDDVWQPKELDAARDKARQAECAKRAAEGHARKWAPQKITQIVRDVFLRKACPPIYQEMLDSLVGRSPQILDLLQRYVRRRGEEEEDENAFGFDDPEPEVESDEDEHKETMIPLGNPAGPNPQELKEEVNDADNIEDPAIGTEPGASELDDLPAVPRPTPAIVEHACRFRPVPITLSVCCPPSRAGVHLEDASAFVPEHRLVAADLHHFQQRGDLVVKFNTQDEAAAATPEHSEDGTLRFKVTFDVYFCGPGSDTDTNAVYSNAGQRHVPWFSRSKDQTTRLLRILDRQPPSKQTQHNWRQHVERELDRATGDGAGRHQAAALPPSAVLMTAQPNAPEPPSDAEFHPKMKPHQRNGAWWMHQMEQTYGGGCLCDDCGFGKTLTTLALLHLFPLKDDEHTLIVAPIHTVSQWISEWKKWYPETSNQFRWLQPEELLSWVKEQQRVCRLRADGIDHGQTPKEQEEGFQSEFEAKFKEFQEDEMKPHRYWFIDYKTLGKIAKWAKEMGYNLLKGFRLHRIALDEPHKLHSLGVKEARWTSLPGSFINSLPARCRWCITSTPRKRGPIDLLSMLYFVGAPMAAPLLFWMKKRNERNCQGPVQVPECVSEQFGRLMLRRTPSDISTEHLPTLSHARVPLKPHPRETALYQWVVHCCADFLKTGALRTADGEFKSSCLDGVRHVLQDVLPFVPGLPTHLAGTHKRTPFDTLKTYLGGRDPVRFLGCEGGQTPSSQHAGPLGAETTLYNVYNGVRKTRTGGRWCDHSKGTRQNRPQPLVSMTMLSTNLLKLLKILGEQQQRKQKVVVFTASPESTKDALSFIKLSPLDAKVAVAYSDQLDLQKEFQKARKTVALFMTVTSVCEGLDLHYVNMAVFLDPVLDSAAAWQALGRIRRLSDLRNQEKEVVYLHYDLPIPKKMTDLQIGAGYDLDTKLAEVLAELLKLAPGPEDLKAPTIELRQQAKVKVKQEASPLTHPAKKRRLLKV